MVILCCTRGEDAGVGSGGRVCFVGFFEGHGGGGGSGVLEMVVVVVKSRDDRVRSDITVSDRLLGEL